MKFAMILLFALSLQVRAQYQITSSTIGGGGGASTGGVYTVTGTLGQPDTGVLSGGPYTLAAGFWSSAVVVPVEGSPLLRVEQNNPQIILAWPNPSTGFQLQSSPGLSVPIWSDLNAPTVVVGQELQATLPMEPGVRFFRLHKP